MAEIPARAGSAVRCADRRRARSTRAWSSGDRPGRAAEARSRHAVLAARARRARAGAAQAAVSVAPRRLRPQRRSSARTSCCGIRTRSASATTSWSTTTACSTPRARRNEGIAIGSGVFIGRNTILSCKNGDIEIEDGANIGFNCELFSASHVRVGPRHARRRVLLRDRRRPRGVRSVAAGAGAGPPVAPASTVGAGAWLGAGAKILDGVTIGDRAVVGAGAVVREAVPARAIAVGVPARVVGTRDEGQPVTAGERSRESDGTSGREAERPAGLRSPRLGGIAHARREAAVRLDDSRASIASATTSRWSACARRICRRRRSSRSASTSPTCTSRSSIRRRCRRC